MRVVILLVVLCNLHNLGLSEDVNSSMLLKTYPKKFLPIHVYNAKLINSARIVKKAGKSKKVENADAMYTAFPDHLIKNTPDSPYFPLGTEFEPKPPRVKKTLNSIVRLKRAATNDMKKISPAKVANPSEKTLETKNPAPATKKVTVKKSGPLRNLNGKDPKVSKNKNPRKVSRSGKKVKKQVKRSRSQKSSHKSRLRSKSKHSLRSDLKAKHSSKSDGKKHKSQVRSGHKRLRSGGDKEKKVASKVQKDMRRLIAARDAAAENFPYMVSIQKDGEHWCAGALLNKRLITTTANCFWKSISVSHMKVRAGSRMADMGGQTAWIQQVMKHPKWSIRKYPDNDVALALLDRNIKFSDAVHEVDLPNRVMLPPFDDAWVTSFGSERRDGVYEPQGRTLQVYHVRLLDHNTCNNVTQRFGVVVTDNFICLAQTGRRAPCTRDTGAPAVSDGVLWGLASWGIRKLCGTERFPAMFTYIASQSNMDFIINATKVLMSEERENPMLDRMPKLVHTTTQAAAHQDYQE